MLTACLLSGTRAKRASETRQGLEHGQERTDDSVSTDSSIVSVGTEKLKSAMRSCS